MALSVQAESESGESTICNRVCCGSRLHKVDCRAKEFPLIKRRKALLEST